MLSLQFCPFTPRPFSPPLPFFFGLQSYQGGYFRLIRFEKEGNGARGEELNN